MEIEFNALQEIHDIIQEETGKYRNEMEKIVAIKVICDIRRFAKELGDEE